MAFPVFPADGYGILSVFSGNADFAVCAVSSGRSGNGYAVFSVFSVFRSDFHAVRAEVLIHHDFQRGISVSILGNLCLDIFSGVAGILLIAFPSYAYTASKGIGFRASAAVHKQQAFFCHISDSGLQISDIGRIGQGISLRLFQRRG